MRKFSALLLVVFCSLSAAELPVLPFAEPEGMERLYRSNHKADFAKLANHFRTQSDRMTCGLVVGAIVLNALRYNTEKAPLVDISKQFLDQMPIQDDGKRYDPRLHMYTEQNFLNEAASKIKSLPRLYNLAVDGKVDPGISLEQMRRIFAEAHGLEVKKFAVGTAETATNLENAKPLSKEESDAFLAEIKNNLAQKDNYVVINFARKSLKQPGVGHLSPVAAYDEKSDSFLVLDVNPFGSPWFWVDSEDLINAMNTRDKDADSNRGFLLISDK